MLKLILISSLIIFSGFFGIDAKIDIINSIIVAGDTKYEISPVGIAAQELVVVSGLENWVKKQL